jgi:hypothetical protein
MLSAQTRPTTRTASGFADMSITEARIQDLRDSLTFTHLAIPEQGFVPTAKG